MSLQAIFTVKQAKVKVIFPKYYYKHYGINILMWLLLPFLTHTLFRVLYNHILGLKCCMHYLYSENKHFFDFFLSFWSSQSAWPGIKFNLQSVGLILTWLDLWSCVNLRGFLLCSSCRISSCQWSSKLISNSFTCTKGLKDAHWVEIMSEREFTFHWM